MDRTLASDATVINADGSTYTSAMTDLLDWCDTLVVVSDNSGLNVKKRIMKIIILEHLIT